jgi:hypothetical protein
MNKFALIGLAAVLGVTACSYDNPPPPPPPPRTTAPAPPPPPPAPPPGGLTLTGTVVDTRGRCHAVAGDNGVRYAVHRGGLRGIPRGTKVRIDGVVHPNQDCPGSTVIRVDSIRRLGPGPRAELAK